MAAMKRIEVSVRGGNPRDDIKVDTRGETWLRFTLSSGDWFEVRVIEDSEPGLVIMGERAFGVLPRASNVAILIPRGEKVP